MSKQTKANTTRGVSSLLKTGAAGLHSSGNGLYLKVSGINSGSWIFRYKINSKAGKIGLGSTDTVTLAQAALLVAEQRALIAQGIDPKAHREAVDKQAEAERKAAEEAAAAQAQAVALQLNETDAASIAAAKEAEAAERKAERDRRYAARKARQR